MAPSHPLIGQRAPSVTLPNSDGTPYTITPGGRPIALFFYPKSGTYGCTREACAFRDDSQKLEVYKRSNVEVIGVSGDDVSAQKKFVDEHGLPYPVLSDKDGGARKAYSVPKGLLGMSEGRTTFIIDQAGVVRDVYDGVLNYAAHGKFVEKWLTTLDAEGSAAPAAST